MKATIDYVNKEKRKVVLIGHDLGAYFSFGFDKEFPNYVDQMVLMDVSYRNEDKKFQLNSLILLIYQLTLSFCFLLGYPIGDFILWIILKLCFKLNNLEAEVINSKTCYHFFYFWLSNIAWSSSLFCFSSIPQT